ncbi:multicopper oxidase family protein [Cryobacterium sp. SO2]|uniref:multicopper oxidase family protein n=1 Tax=Cryobacterium sp. SO2 TaxID=1897060 RepID=UPI00223D2D4A|nr:multicopper oxidase family protein [Cryobacterium sp. SO2]WEO78607.1 multicopper oxidase family protein [Cryobacterium sp. SO2]
MTTALLLALDLGAAILTAAAWIAAAVLAVGLRTRGSPTAAAPSADAGPAVPTVPTAPDAAPALTRRRRRGWLAVALLGVGLAGLVAQLLCTALLADHGWWFVQEKALFALPVATVGAIAAVLLAGPDLWAVAHGIRPALGARGAAALVGAAATGVAGVAARVVIGYPIEPVPALVLLALIGLVTALAHAVFAGRPKRVVTGLAAFSALVLVASVGVVWLSSAALPGALASAHEHTAAGPPAPGDVSVTELRTPAGQPGTLRTFDLTAGQQNVTLASGTSVAAWTYGSLPGPELRVDQGDLVEVTLHNTDIADGVTIHWHGYDVPAGEDGVAGVTQNAVLPGDSFTYRFPATDPGTYWYHTHQVSSDGVRRGLYGSLVVLPPGGVPESVDLTVPLHTLGGSVILGESDAATTRAVPAGQSVRLRLINTDQVPHRFHLDGGPFTVVAADGRDLLGPTPVTGKALRIPAGGRLDVSVEIPDSGLRLTSNASAEAVLSLSPGGETVPAPADPADSGDLDLLHYGTPQAQALPTGGGQVEATMVLDRNPRFLGGRPVYGYTVNGDVFPHIPSIEVSEGNTVRLTVANRGAETHPMHVHGHHVRVVSRDGIRSTGSPLWLDTFDVQPGEVWVVEFVADNPGIWLDHCHNLEHAAEGMMMALAYRGVASPFEQGGEHGNRSE